MCSVLYCNAYMEQIDFIYRMHTAIRSELRVHYYDGAIFSKHLNQYSGKLVLNK